MPLHPDSTSLPRFLRPLFRLLALSVLAPWLAGAALPAAAEQAYGPIRHGDTLWQIAGRIYTGTNLSRDQIMLALLRANPDAFSPSCNINGVMRVGAALRLPAPEQVAALDAEAARQTIQHQTQDWEKHRRVGLPLECPSIESVTTEPELANRPPAQVEPVTKEAQEANEVPAGVEEAWPAAQPVAPLNIEAQKPEPVDSTTTTAQVPDTSCPCPPERDSPDRPVPTAPPPPAPLLVDIEEPEQAPPGQRAPGWMLAALVLALISAGMVSLEQRRAMAASKFTATGALDAAAHLPRRALLLLATGSRELPVLLLLAALVGFLGALVTVLFREGIHGMEWLFSGHAGGLVFMAETLPPWQRLLLPAAGGLVAGLILHQIGNRLRGRSSTDYMEAVAAGDGWISVRHSLVKALSSLFTVASGGSIGREGAMVQLAAMVASALGRLSHFPQDRLRLLVAAGAAAGLASAYNAPIAATLFVAEIVLGSIALEHIGPLIIAAVIANVTVHDILGYAPVYQLPSFSLVSDWELGLYLLLGLAAGHVAPFFLRLLERSHQLFGRLPVPLAARMALGGLLVGAISVYEPQVWGNGYSVVNSVLHTPWAWQALLTVLLLKMLATAATHGSGAVGGAFTPTLFVGALLGALFGILVHTVLPVGTAPPSAYAVVGMGAMLAGTTHAPLMSILMVLEMTTEYQIVLPLMLAVITAHYTAQRYTGVRPMYAESLLPREAST